MSRAVTLEVIHEVIRDLALNVVKDLQQLSFRLVKDMKQILCDVRELGKERHFRKAVREVMKEAMITSKIVMNFVNSIDAVIQSLKNQFRGMDSFGLLAED